jgi:hypothetical protein
MSKGLKNSIWVKTGYSIPPLGCSETTKESTYRTYYVSIQRTRIGLIRTRKASRLTECGIGGEITQPPLFDKIEGEV